MLTKEPAYITDTSLSMVIASDTLILDVNDAKNIIGKKITDKIMIFI
jgi:hypothetical protein